MTDLAPTLLDRLKQHHQEHVLHGWESLPAAERAALAKQLEAINFDELAALFAKKDEPATSLPSRDRIAPLPVEAPSADAVAVGEAALRRGEVAVLLVAGGQGSRLGFDQPKGMFPVGPVSGATLFRIHAEKVLALSRRYGKPVPFLVMTSPATHADTVAYFEKEHRFGLPSEQVHFFQQGTMPAVDLTTGKLLLEKPGQLALSPNGHGGTLTALADSGLLAKLKAAGVKHVFYFQVDNPLVNVCDPAFVGRHAQASAEVSSKVVFKERAEEKVGVLAQIDGRCGVIEYSDMPTAMAEERAADGTLAFRAGSPAIHLFGVPFLERVTSGSQRLAFHLARKKVPHFDPSSGQTTTPAEPNALKFELFVFDALPMAERWLAVEAKREDEFAPLKNATGADSLTTCQALMIGQARRWLRAAGATVADDAVVEISPTFALDAGEVQAKVKPGSTVSEASYFTAEGT
jgi:UDP-N-acetylglucosamine/UDP-N-acetylgalactosamine diphosphorylase